MAENSAIEWTDHTFNPWIGCTRVSVAAAGGGGCDNCYAAVSTPARAMGIAWGAGEPRHRTAAPTWRQPLTWNARHADFFTRHGRRQRVFCASLADVFDNEVVDEWRVDLFRLIAATPNLDWLLLTKRIGNAAKMIHTAVHSLIREANNEQQEPPYWPWPNVWLGVTVVNQEEADRDIPKLLATPARVRFLSMEPLLGPVRLDQLAYATIQHSEEWTLFMNALTGFRATSMQSGMNGPKLDWVIVGGESGRGARPLQLQWVWDIVRQCQAADVSVLVKQLGQYVLDHGMAGPGEHWPGGIVRQPGVPRQTEFDPGFMVHLKDRKGGDWLEWPEDLRVRQFPAVAS